MHTTTEVKPFSFLDFDTSQERCDEIMYRMALAQKNLGLSPMEEKEVNLFHHKWFDYRFENPVVSTYRFADAYSNAYQFIYARNFDRTKAEFVRGMRARDPFDFSIKNSERSGLWRARQIADALGITYDFYCETAMQIALDRVKYARPPRPSHLYEHELVEKINAKWLETLAGRLILAKDPRFKLQSYSGLHAQDDYHEYLMSLAAMRINPHHLLGRFLYQDGLLPVSKAIARFGNLVVERAAKSIR